MDRKIYLWRRIFQCMLEYYDSNHPAKDFCLLVLDQLSLSLGGEVDLDSVEFLLSLVEYNFYKEK